MQLAFLTPVSLELADLMSGLNYLHRILSAVLLSLNLSLPMTRYTTLDKLANFSES